MEEIDIFLATYGPGIVYDKISANVIDQYIDRAPDFLTKIWKVNGLCHFDDGFWALVNPIEYAEILAMFIPNSENNIVLMRTAFGGLFYMESKSDASVFYFYLCPMKKKIVRLGDQFADVFNSWLTTDFLFEPLMYHQIYRQARKRLPIPGSNECYAFVPALALGGEPDADHVKINQILAHMQFLSQLE